MDSFTYTVTDADGDTSTAVLSFTFSGDNSHAVAGTTTALVDEDDLASRQLAMRRPATTRLGAARAP